jgi:hypothetical protein
VVSWLCCREGQDELFWILGQEMPILHPDQSWHALPDLISTSDAVSLVVTCHYRIPQVVSTGSALPDDVEFCTSVYTTGRFGCPSAEIWKLVEMMEMLRQGDTAWIPVSSCVTMKSFDAFRA